LFLKVNFDFKLNFVTERFFPLMLFSFTLQERDSYWKMMQKYVGSDITSMVTLPVIIFEPMTMLQKMAEVSVICVHCCILCHYFDANYFLASFLSVESH